VTASGGGAGVYRGSSGASRRFSIIDQLTAPATPVISTAPTMTRAFLDTRATGTEAPRSRRDLAMVFSTSSGS
jgi:hypothetical protein